MIGRLSWRSLPWASIVATAITALGVVGAPILLQWMGAR